MLTSRLSTVSCLTAALIATACGRPQQANSDGSAGSNGRVVLQNKGSDTLVNVAQAWAEAYKEVEPNVAIAVTGGGSGTGISSMINGTVDIASSSRAMKASELESAKKNGSTPVEHIVGYAALAVYLHPDNPINELTISQIKSIYGEGGTFEKWADLGIEVPGCSSDEIIRISRQNNSGTYAYFKKATLSGAEYKLGSRDMHGSKDVVDLVEKTPCAIGYSGLAYATDHIKTPCIKKDDASECVTPTMTSAAESSYPIARPLFMYTAGAPTGATKTYMDWIMSDVGQCIIETKGYAPIREITCE